MPIYIKFKIVIVIVFAVCEIPIYASSFSVLGNGSVAESLFMNVFISLFTQQNPTTPFIFKPDDDIEVLNKSQFDVNLETKLIIGGWMAGHNNELLIDLVGVLLLEKHNIFVISWSDYYLNFIYPLAVYDSLAVAEKTYNFLKKLNAKYNYPYEKIHMIGHSLGAHVAGYAGSKLNGSIARISGLDPAGPLITGNPYLHMLKYTDAKFVDAIHTSAVGTIQHCGHVDFYPNGGRQQRKCGPFYLFNIASYLKCNHEEALIYYRKSINGSCVYKSYQCSNYEKFLHDSCNDCGKDNVLCNCMGYKASWPNTYPANDGFYWEGEQVRGSM